MISIALEVLKKFLGFAFGSKSRSMISIGVIGAIGLAVSAMWLTNQYNSVKIENAKLRSANEAFDTANQALITQVQNLEDGIKSQSEEYESAIIKRRSLEDDLLKVREARTNDQQVFEKECGRLERLMQKKASLVVRLANRGTKRVFKQLEAATETAANNN